MLHKSVGLSFDGGFTLDLNIDSTGGLKIMIDFNWRIELIPTDCQTFSIGTSFGILHTTIDFINVIPRNSHFDNIDKSTDSHT